MACIYNQTDNTDLDPDFAQAVMEGLSNLGENLIQMVVAHFLLSLRFLNTHCLCFIAITSTQSFTLMKINENQR